MINVIANLKVCDILVCIKLKGGKFYGIKVVQ